MPLVVGLEVGRSQLISELRTMAVKALAVAGLLSD